VCVFFTRLSHCLVVFFNNCTFRFSFEGFVHGRFGNNVIEAEEHLPQLRGSV
jgi:hypothetical protein